MTTEKVNDLIKKYKKIIPIDKVTIFHKHIKEAHDNDYQTILSTKTYNPTVILLLSIFLGGLGIDRMLIGDISCGICKLLFGWLTFGIWPIIDIFLTYKRAKEKNLINLISYESYN